MRVFDDDFHPPESLVDIWKKDHVRIFISHRDDLKVEAKKLAHSLLSFGVSSFVAHDSIDPLDIWQDTIKKALQTCEVMVLFIDENFFESLWTNQEIGFALGKNIPIIPIKLDSTDPQGFNISNIQALKGDIRLPGATAKKIYDVLINKLHMENQLKEVIIKQFVQTSDYKYTRPNFMCLENIKNFAVQEIRQIITAYEKNKFLNGGYYLNNEHTRFEKFLRERTGENYIVNGPNVSVGSAVS